MPGRPECHARRASSQRIREPRPARPGFFVLPASLTIPGLQLERTSRCLLSTRLRVRIPPTHPYRSRDQYRRVRAAGHGQVAQRKSIRFAPGGPSVRSRSCPPLAAAGTHRVLTSTVSSLVVPKAERERETGSRVTDRIQTVGIPDQQPFSMPSRRSACITAARRHHRRRATSIARVRWR
jgi:hypothetical protein